MFKTHRMLLPGFFGCLTALFSMAVTGWAQADCARFPRDSVAPVVEVCAENNLYSFRIGDKIKSFDQEYFQRKVSLAINDWVATHHEDKGVLNQARVEIWMTVPEANPEAAQPRAVVATSKGQISFWFDLRKDQWVFSDTETAILHDAVYPESFGHRPHRVLIKARPGIPRSAVEMALGQDGAKDISHQGGESYVASCPLFVEHDCAKALFSNHQDVLKYVQVNSIVEWIADRQMAFSFPLSPFSE